MSLFCVFLTYLDINSYNIMSEQTTLMGLTSLLGIGGILAWMYTSSLDDSSFNKPRRKKASKSKSKYKHDDDEPEEEDDFENDDYSDNEDEFSDNEDDVEPLDIGDEIEDDDLDIENLDEENDVYDDDVQPKKRGRPKKY